MSRRMPRRGRGRPRLIDDDAITKKLIEATQAGSPIRMAARYAGISERAFQVWMQRGYEEIANREDGEPADHTEQPFVDLYNKVMDARAQAGVSAVVLIRRAAQGGQIVNEKTRRFRDQVTGQIVEETEVERMRPDWKAAAWLLDRQHPELFQQKALQLEVTGEGGGPVQVNVDATDFAAKIIGNIAALTGVDHVPALLEAPDVAGSELVVVDGELVD